MEWTEGEGSEGKTYNTEATRSSERGWGQSEMSDVNEATLTDFSPPEGYPKLPANLREETTAELRASIMKTRCAADPGFARQVIASLSLVQHGWCNLVQAKGTKGARHEGYVQVSFDVRPKFHLS